MFEKDLVSENATAKVINQINIGAHRFSWLILRQQNTFQLAWQMVIKTKKRSRK